MSHNQTAKRTSALCWLAFGVIALLAPGPTVAYSAQDGKIRPSNGPEERAEPRRSVGPRHVAVDGTVTFDFSGAVLDSLGIRFLAHGHLGPKALAEEDLYETRAMFEVGVSSTLEIELAGGLFDRITGGDLVTSGALRLHSAGEGDDRVVIGNLTLRAAPDGALTVVSGFDQDDTLEPIFDVPSVMIDFDAASGELKMIGELAVAVSWAEERKLREAAGVVVGNITVDAGMAPRVGTAPVETCRDTQTANPITVADSNPGADVIIGDLQSVLRYQRVGDITAFAVGTNACNIGDERASWIWYTNQHPLIFEHLHRLDDRGFQQVGMCWVKHGFYAVSESLCSVCMDPTDGSELGVGCSDPYSAPLNGEQRNMSPRAIVNAHTGYFVYTGYDYNYSTAIDRRLQVHDADLDPAQNPGARYFIEGYYIHPDDSAAGNQDNNGSYREVSISNPSQDSYNINIQSYWPTRRGQAGLRAWQDVDPSVVETDVHVPDEGLFILAAKVTQTAPESWHYSYALQNLNSDRSARSFSVPLPADAVVSNIGFHDVDYHSGDPYDLTDWSSEVGSESITWYTDTYATNINANALRYGTIYNFSFDCDVEAASRIITVGLFKPGTPGEVTAQSLGPRPVFIDCNGNEIADECDLSCSPAGCSEPCATSPDCDGNGVPDECDHAECAGDPDCEDCNHNGVLDGCESGCANASAANLADGETVTLNPGGGTYDPTLDALVVFTNQSGSGGAFVSVNETVDEVHPAGNGYALSATLLIVDTSLADGEFLMKVAIPFEQADLREADPLTSDLIWFDHARPRWEPAVARNVQNSPGQNHPVGDRHVDSGTTTPSLAELSNDVGDFGVFWNTSTLRGFVWANVDHATDFTPAVQIAKNRYVAMVVPPSIVAGPGRETAIRVHLTSLHHPESPLNAPDFGAWEGNYRWVNSLTPDHTCPDSPNFGTTIRCALLGCSPEYRDWAAQLGGEVLYVTGAAVVPSSHYTLARLDEICAGQEATCAEVSEEVSVSTADHGDVDPLADGLVVLDIARIVDHIKGKAGALFKPMVHLRPNVPDTLEDNVGVLDVATAVDAVKGNPYKHSGPFGPCSDACPGEVPCP